MEDEGPTLLDRLIAYNKVVKIKVRACRIWRPRHPGLGNKYAGLHCILVDEKEEAKLTLWSDIAHSFSSVSLEALSQPTVALFTSLRVKLYADNIILTSTGSLFFIDPDTPELNSYKSVTLPPSNQANETDILQTGKRVTIEELGYLDPDLYKDDMFLCKASIK